MDSEACRLSISPGFARDQPHAPLLCDDLETPYWALFAPPATVAVLREGKGPPERA
jgi:hypothetical protein